MCEAGAAIGCSTLASMYENGIGVPADAARAEEFYRRACSAGAERGCEKVKAGNQQRADEEQRQREAAQREQVERQRQEAAEREVRHQRGATWGDDAEAHAGGKGIASFKSFLGMQCGDSEAQITKVLGAPSARYPGGGRTQIMWNDLGIAVQIVEKTGRLAYVQYMLALRKKPAPVADPKAQYLGGPASAVKRDFGAPSSPGDAMLYQDQKAKMMVSFLCPPTDRCTSIGVYCLGE
jgi:hypothetical protein